MKRVCIAAAAALLSGCANVPGALEGGTIVVGRIISEEPASHFFGDVEFVAHIYKLRPNRAPAAEVEFYTENSLCPANPPGDRSYLLVLNKTAKIFDTKTRKESSMLEVYACTPVDEKTSSGIFP